MKSNYKMVVMDMDFTLLNSQKQISERNMCAIQRAMEKGIKVVVATGRIYASAKYYGKLLGSNMPVIGSNGAMTYDEENQKTIQRYDLPKETVSAILTIGRKHGIACHLFSHDTIYAEQFSNVCGNYDRWNTFIENEENKVKIQIKEDLMRLIDEGTAIIKVIAVDDGKKIADFRREVVQTVAVSVSQSLKNNVEFMSPGATKGNAVKQLAELYGIKREEIIAMGDNENDISMITYAGLGVAMDNAEQCLKEVADYITDSCDDSGVAKVIEKFILKEDENEY